MDAHTSWKWLNVDFFFFMQKALMHRILNHKTSNVVKCVSHNFYKIPERDRFSFSASYVSRCDAFMIVHRLS